MQPIKNVLKRPTSSPTRNMLNAFFLPEDQDGFARSQGYADAEQMIYYEDRERMEVPPMTDNEVEKMVEREEAVADESGTVEYLAPPPSEILVLMRQEVEDIVKRAEEKRLAELASIHEAARRYELSKEEDEACPLTLWYDTSAELAGVY